MRKYKKYEFLLFLIFATVGCKSEINPTIETKKVIAVTQILELDRIKNKYKVDKKYISNIPMLPPVILEYYDIENNKSTVFNSRLKYLDFILKTEDTSFIKKQIESDNSQFWNELHMSKLSIFDAKKIDNDSLYNYLNKNSDRYIMITPPIFDKTGKRCFMKIGTLHSGVALIGIKQNGNWEIKETLSEWVE